MSKDYIIELVYSIGDRIADLFYCDTKDNLTDIVSILIPQLRHSMNTLFMRNHNEIDGYISKLESNILHLYVECDRSILSYIRATEIPYLINLCMESIDDDFIEYDKE